MPTKKLSEADRVAIRREVAEQETPTRTLARRYRVTVQTIRNVLRGLNSQIYTGVEAMSPAGTWANMDKDKRREKVLELLDEGLNKGEVAKQLHISRPLVSRILKGER